MSTLGDAFAATLWHKMIGQGSQECEGQAVARSPAVPSVQPRNPMRAAQAMNRIRGVISDSGNAAEVRVFHSTSVFRCIMTALGQQAVRNSADSERAGGAPLRSWTRNPNFGKNPAAVSVRR